MSIMTKQDLATQLAAVKFPLSKAAGMYFPQKTMVDLVETLFDLLVCHFQNGGDKIVIRGFGTFRLRRRRSFLGTDPRNGEAIEVPARYSISFKPGRETVRRINNK